MSKPAPHFYEFGTFRLSLSERLLLHEGHVMPLPQKALETLLVLLENSGHVVEKEELMRQLWPDSFVEENNLTHYISFLRKALADGGDGRRFIETVPKRGYRFVADVRELRGEDAELVFTEYTRSRVVIRDEIEETDEDLRPQNLRATATDAAQLSTGRRGLSTAAAAMVAVLALAATAGVAYLFMQRHAEQSGAATLPTSRPEVRSIAVLPFRQLGAKTDEDYLGLGVADALITKLGQLKQLSVRPTGAIQKHTRETRDPVAVGRELKVDAVLDGRLLKSGEQIRVTVQLINVRDGTLLWTGQFDEKAADLLAVQDAISEQAVQAMRLQLSAWERERLAKPATTNAEAYQAYLKGRYYWNKRTLEGFNKGIENFRQAIDLDPNYAQAYAGLADCHNLLAEYSGALPKDSFTAARQAANKALEIDESLAEAHTSLAYILFNYDWNWPAAEKEFKRAVELNPNYATAHQWYAEYLMMMGRLDEAQDEFARALQIDPLSLIINAEQGLPALTAGRYEEAIEKFQKAADLDPNFGLVHAYLRAAYELSGRPDQAFSEYLVQGRFSGLSPADMNGVKKAYERRGLRALWQDELAREMAWRRETTFSSYMIARCHARLGDKEAALNWLEQAYKERDRFLIGSRHDPAFTDMHSDPRYQDLLRRMNLGS